MAEERRADSRNANDLRPMACERRVLRRADGSARYSQGLTSVLVAVFGPCEVKKRREELDRVTLEVIVRPPGGPPRPREREMEGLLHGLFTPLIVGALHPRTAISIVVQLVEDDGAALAAAVNCTAVALMDAGVAMRSIPSAVALALDADGSVANALLDPSRNEEDAALGVLTVACAHMPSSNPKDDGAPSVALITCSGSVLDPEQLDAHIRLAQGSHDLVVEFAKRALAEGMLTV